jgi:hypothetical protein
VAFKTYKYEMLKLTKYDELGRGNNTKKEEEEEEEEEENNDDPHFRWTVGAFYQILYLPERMM